MYRFDIEDELNFIKNKIDGAEARIKTDIFWYALLSGILNIFLFVILMVVLN